MGVEAVFSGAARAQGKKARTRARLMDAAVQIFARDGYEAASVNEIARQADVANGTFYAHFKDREEIAAAVVFAMTADIARQLDDAMTGIDDAIQRMALATRTFIDLAARQPDWGRAMFRAFWHSPNMRSESLSFVRADLQRGVDQGVFTVGIDDFLVDMHVAMTASALLARLNGEAGPEAGSRAVELQLRMLGVTPDRARAAAWRPLPG